MKGKNVSKSGRSRRKGWIEEKIEVQSEKRAFLCLNIDFKYISVKLNVYE